MNSTVGHCETQYIYKICWRPVWTPHFTKLKDNQTLTLHLARIAMSPTNPSTNCLNTAHLAFIMHTKKKLRPQLTTTHSNGAWTKTNIDKGKTLVFKLSKWDSTTSSLLTISLNHLSGSKPRKLTKRVQALMSIPRLAENASKKTKNTSSWSAAAVPSPKV